MRRLATLAAALALSTSAYAQTIDQSGATQIQQDLARYTSPAAFEKGILKVTPDSTGYRIDIDLKPLVALIPEMPELGDGFKLDVTPYSILVSPRPDGTWAVSGNTLVPDGKYELTTPDVTVKGEWTVAGGKHSGIYDPALAAYTSGEASLSSMSFKGEDPTGRRILNYGASTFTVSGTANPNGGVDVISRQEIAGFDDMQQFQLPDGAGTSVPVSTKAPSMTANMKGTGVRSRALLDLLAFGVANNDEAKIKANQAELKTLLLAALPLWESIMGAQDMDKLAITTPMGSLNAERINVSFSGHGVRDDGEMALGVKLDTMRISSLFMPAWAPPLLPTYVDFNLKVDNLDLDQPVKKAIAALDLSQDPPLPDAVGEEIAAAFQASPPRLLIQPSTLRSNLSEFTVEGAMTFPAGEPNFLGTVEARDLDKTIDALKTAAEQMPELNESILGAQMAKGMAKTLPDGRLQWLIEAKGDGSVSINGQMVKGPDEPEAPPSVLQPEPDMQPEPAEPEAPKP